MAAFDLYRPDGELVLDVQSDLVDVLSTRVVVPLMPPERAPLPARRLNPVFGIDDGRFVLVTQFVAAVPAGALGPAVGSLAAERDAVRDALDMLFIGF